MRAPDTRRSPRSRSLPWSRIAAGIGLVAAIIGAYYVFRVPEDPKHVDDLFLSALARKDWATAYRMDSDLELQRLGWSETKFVRFAEAISRDGWPTFRKISSWITPAGPPPDEEERLRAVGLPPQMNYNPVACRNIQIEITGGAQVGHCVYRLRRLGRRWYPDLIEGLLMMARASQDTEGVRTPITDRYKQALEAVGEVEIPIFPAPGTYDAERLNLGLSRARKLG